MTLRDRKLGCFADKKPPDGVSGDLVKKKHYEDKLEDSYTSTESMIHSSHSLLDTFVKDKNLGGIIKIVLQKHPA